MKLFERLFSIFVPKQNNDTSTTEIVTLTFVLPITQNTSQILSLNNNLLIANNYLNSAQCNILKTCVSFCKTILSLSGSLFFFCCCFSYKNN